MPPISKFRLDDRVLEKLTSLFFEIVGKKHSKDEFNRIIADILSPVERIMIAKRIAIIYLLTKGIDYQSICTTLKVSAATVAKFRLISQRSDGIVPAFDKIIRHEKIANFLEEVFATLYPPGVPGTNWKAAWQRKRETERRSETGI